MAEEETVKGILYNWETTDIHCDMRVRGQTVLDLPRTASRDEWVITTPVQRFFRVDGQLHVETKNSLHMLVDDHPFRKGN